MKDIVKVFKALADETRLRLLKVLTCGEFCVCELVDALEVEQSNLSRHLAALRGAGLVSDRKEGLWVYYTVAQGAKALVKRLLAAFGDRDTPRTYLDWKRLQQRLQMRVDGKCPLGAGKLPPSRRNRRW